MTYLLDPESATAHSDELRKLRNTCEGCGWNEAEPGETFCSECTEADSLTQPEIQEIANYAA